MGRFEGTVLNALGIGALCHDIGHRGRNTSFEIQTKSELAMRYNDRSPLENHHCAKAFEIALKTPGDKCNIFKKWNQESYSRVRRILVSIILGTDMALHGEHVQRLTSMGDALYEAETLPEVILHSADISNPIMPTEQSSRWNKAIQNEFMEQVVDERQYGIPISHFMEGLDDPAKATR